MYNLKMRIRPAQTEDTASIINLGHCLISEHQKLDLFHYQVEEDFSGLFSNWVRDTMANLNHFIIVAENEEDESKIIGFISGFIKVLYPWFKQKYIGHISFLVVDPAFRNKNIGDLLEKKACGWFRQRNLKTIELFVDTNNFLGNQAWKSYGFIPAKKLLRKIIQT